MDWDDLRVFLTVCQTGSLNSAGQALGMNHTTVGRRIAALEEQLDTRLFDKSRGGYSMTQAAEEILRRATAMDEHARAILRENVGRDRELRGNLVLTVPYDFADAVLIPELGTFTRQYPKIELELSTSLDLENLDSRDADLALRITKTPPEHLVGRRVHPLCLGVYGSRRYLEKHGPQELILHRGQRKLPKWAEQFPDAKLSCRIDSVGSQLNAVRSGLGIARLPCFIGDGDQSLRRLPVEVVSDWGIWVLHHPDLRATARVRACRDFLYDVLERQRTLLLGENSRFFSGGA